LVSLLYTRQIYFLGFNLDLFLLMEQTKLNYLNTFKSCNQKLYFEGDLFPKILKGIIFII